ncbi:hypothetical protein BCN13_11980 [Salmonella enterica]|nr:hypothetical protein [Salmonella enterica]EAO7616166.1 hypothetical protein [Salmonella enterica]EAQ6816888.1 hypothetical protein [Salmonella enterica]
MDVSIPLVEGKALEQYKEELLAQARERITNIYKEIVCGGELDDEIIIPVRGDIAGEYGIKVANKNGKLSIVGLVGGASDLLGLLRNEIKPSELSHESLAEADKASTGEAMKTFLVEDGKIVMNAKYFTIINSPNRDNLEERVALLERRLSGKRSMHVGEKVVEFYNPDGTLAMRIGDINQDEEHLKREEVLKYMHKKMTHLMKEVLEPVRELQKGWCLYR